ncbi:MAG: DUF3089 domain-containing protein [Oscillospiraceae bacterium]
MKDIKQKKTKYLLSVCSILMAFSVLFLSACSTITSKTNSIYKNENSWAYLSQGNEKPADCFLICPTVYMGETEKYNMAIDDENIRGAFVGALNMEKGIYEENCRMFAPFYRQAALNVYKMETEKSKEYFDLAYSDIKDSFQYYMANYNDGRPFVLAGFSQGADMCLRLMKDLFDDENYSKHLIACYAIGWRVTEEEIADYPQLKMAKSETDTGVIISFNSEAKEIKTSSIVPKNTVAINPLNWKTDSTYAPPTLNKGACFTDYGGKIIKETTNLTGAYIDENRGTLKVDDSITYEEYPPGLDIFENGIYHGYDYQFFYRNLQENVSKRIAEFK